LFQLEIAKAIGSDFMKKRWIDYDPDGPIEPTKIVAQRKLIRIIWRELIFNDSLQKVNTEKALKIIQNDNKIDLKGKDKNQWAKMAVPVYVQLCASSTKTLERLSLLIGSRNSNLKTSTRRSTTLPL
jgi:hypothetical protein